VRQRDVERIGGALAVLDLGNGVAQRIDLLAELLGIDVEPYGAPTRRGDQHRVDVILDDRHPVISFAGLQRLLHVGERDHVARHGAVAREAAQRRLGCELVLLGLSQGRPKRAGAGQVDRGRLGQIVEAGEFDAGALDLAGQSHRLPEQA